MVQPPPTAGRRPRADARRNYDRLLSEADTLFAESGAEAPLDQIARRAGVSIGTLYAHFPHRGALIGALLSQRNTALFDRGEALTQASNATEALVTWIRAVLDHAAIYQGLAEILSDGADDAASELHAACLRMTEIGDRLVANARVAGALRDEVTGNDVFALINAVAWSREHTSPRQADRLLSFALDGILPRLSRSLTEPAIEDEAER
ncbi:TetR/AcrR family transcriptional regulator [Nocardia salmonicida]